MPLPGGIVTCILTGTYLATDGTALAGQVSFIPSSLLTDPAGLAVLSHTPLTARLQAGTGRFSVTLACTDNADLGPAGWQWEAVIQVPGAEDSFFFLLPSTLGPSADISSLTPAGAAPTGTTYVSSINGQSGAVELGDGFGIVPPVGDLGGSTTVPEVTSTHLSAPLPIAQGGTGAASGSAALAALGGVSSSGLSGLAPLASPALTGTPTAPTASALADSTQVATTAYADSAVAVETTRAETAEALKAPLASPALTGSPTAPTQTTGDSSTKIATDAFVATAANAAQAAAIAASLPTLAANVSVTTSGTLAVNTVTEVSAGSNLTMTLPASVTGAVIVCEKSDATVNTVAVTGSIRGVGSSTVTLRLQNESEMFLGYAGSWWPVAGHKTLGSLDLRYAPVVLQASGDTTGAKDTAAIGALITAASGGAGLAQLGPGTFWVNAGNAVPAGVTVAGMGQGLTTVKIAAGASGFNVFTTTASNAGWRDLTIDLNKSGTTNGSNVTLQMGIQVSGSGGSLSGLSISRVTVQNGWQQGIALTVGSAITNTITASLQDVTVTSTGDIGVLLVGGLSCQIVRPVCTTCGTGSSRSGIQVQGSTGTQIMQPTCTGNTAHGIVFNYASFNTPCSNFQVTGGNCSGNTGGYGVVVSEGCYDFNITGVRCEGNGEGGLGIDTAWGANQVTGTATSGTVTTLTDSTRSWTTNQWAGWTIRLTGGTGSGESSVITSNTATAFTFGTVATAPDATTTYAIDGSHIFTPVNSTVSGCTCKANTGPGVWVDYVSGLTVTGCDLGSNSTYGINMVAKNCVVTGNNIHDNTSVAVHVANSGLGDSTGGHQIGPNTYSGNGSVFSDTCSIPNSYSAGGATTPGGTSTFLRADGSWSPPVLAAPSVITSTNATWPIPSGAAWLEITPVGGGGQGGGAGSIGASTLTTGLTSGNAVTSLAVTALPVAITSGQSVTIVSGANTQTFTASATAAIAATAVSVTSQNANFSYPIGTSVYGNSWAQGGAGGGAAGCASTQVVAVGSNTTLNVTIGAGGSAAGAGAATAGAAGTAGSNGTATTVTGTGISVRGQGGQGGGASAGSSATSGSAGLFGTTTTSAGNFGAGSGGFQLGGGAPNGMAAGGGGAGQSATYATGGGVAGGSGTAIAGGAAGTGGLGTGSWAGASAVAAGANTAAGGGGGGAGYSGSTGGSGASGGSGFAVIRVVG